MLSSITSTINIYLDMAERSTLVGQNYWKDGFFKYNTAADKDALTLMLLDIMTANSNVFTSQYFTSLAGELWGAYATVTDSGTTFGEWKSVTDYAVDKMGMC